MEYLILALLIINPTIAYATIFKRKFEENLVVTIVTYITILFFTGVLGNLNVGFYFIILANIPVLGYNTCSIIKKRINLKEQIFTFGFIIFVITYLLILWISIERRAIEWDEFTHWTLVVKNMFNLGNLGLGEDANLLCKSYLSGTALFQYFCTKISGEFKEGMIYVGMNLMIVCTIIPMFKNVKSRTNLIPYICYGVMFFVPLYFYSNLYSSVYVDGILALAFAYTLYSYFTDRDENLSKFKILNLMASLLFLAFIKNFGLILAAGALLVMLIDNIFIKNKFKFKELWKNNKYLLLSILPMVVVESIWLGLLKYNNINDVETSGIVPTIFNVIKGDLLPYQKDTIKNYVRALFEIPLVVECSLSFITCIGLSILLAYINKQFSKENKSICIMHILTILGSFAYALVLLFVPFLTLFSEYEAMNLASFARYNSSYILGLIFMELAVLIIVVSENKEKLKKVTLIAFAILIFTFPVIYIEQVTILARNIVQETMNYREAYSKFSNLIKENVKNNEKVYFIANNTKGYEYYVAKYEATPVKLQNIKWSISVSPYYEGDIWTTIMSCEQWEQELSDEFEYVYLYKIDEKFIEIYGSLFFNKDNIKDNQLYKVNKREGQQIILEMVAE